MLVGRGRPFGDMLDETSLKFPFQYLYFVIEECPGAFADKQPDDGRTQIGYLFIGVAHNLERVEDVRLTFVGKVGQQQVLRFLRSENLQYPSSGSRCHLPLLPGRQAGDVRISKVNR